MENPSKVRQRFVDAIVLISTTDWSERFSNFVNVIGTSLEFGLRTSIGARFCQTSGAKSGDATCAVH